MVQFQSARKPKGAFSSAMSISALIYHSVVRSVRKQHNNAFITIGVNVLQVATFVGVFYLMFSIRGDLLVYIMSGIFLFMTHTKTMQSVFASEEPSSPMIQHSPMNTVISIMTAAFGALYIQLLSLFIILYG
jgi:hypothetical protein|tara:strand:+ start:748 stop:1143 length:396 start_codon:yes stop_codon:yes gene_type:complete